MKTLNNRNIVFIEYIRLVALLSVIFFHIMGMLMNRSYLTHIMTLKYLMFVSNYLVGIAVPFFMFISGFLYKKPAKDQTSAFLRKKAVRLLLPYPIFTVLTMLASGFFEFHYLYDGGFWHLWFLTALFWCFVVSVKIDYSFRIAYVILLVSLMLMYVRLPSFLGIQDFVQWFYFFVLGAIVKNHGILQKINNGGIVGLLIVYATINILLPFHYRERSIAHAIAVSSFIMAIWAVAPKIHFAKSGIVESVGKYSMGIYILHYIVLIFILSSTSFRLFHIKDALTIFSILTIVTILAITLIICYICVFFLRINKWTRCMIGG